MMKYRHGGNLRNMAASAGLSEDAILDFSANINPLGPPAWLRQVISAHVSAALHYPDPDCTSLVKAISLSFDVPEDNILPGNGSTELLYTLPRVCKAKRAVIPVPSYADYARAAGIADLPVEKVILKEEKGFIPDLRLLESILRGGDLVFLGQPNNPTGIPWQADDLRLLAGRCPDTFFAVDEAFTDFVEGADSLTRKRPANLIVLRSFTKFFAIPGLRLGCAIGDSAVIAAMCEIMPPWSVNTFALAVGEAALQDTAYAGETRKYVRRVREMLIAELETIPGLTVFPGVANYLLLRLEGRRIDAPLLAGRLLRRGIAIRVCDNFAALDGRFFRVAVRTEEENERLCRSLRAELGETLPPLRQKKPAVMFQGTGSNAGKSVMAAAFCRILLQDGYSVAPYKAQNMSLNSYVTRDGGEMGRAQVVQAQACRIDPDVRMNPILLKPSSDTGAQVIVMGKPVGNMDVEKYIRYKPEAFEAAKDAFNSLSQEYDVIVLEGAGSPAEVNLKHHDIVNMNMARYAESPVLIVGDIDRGGVFASFVGTMEVLAEWERNLVAGFVINRFRGDESLLKDAIDYTKRHTGRPTFGVVPYLRELGLPDEDSVTFKSGQKEGTRPAGDAVEIALIDLPHISNFTDFDSLRQEPDVHLRIVREAEEFGSPDAVIIPGSKNVIGDMEYLKKNGLSRKISDSARSGKTETVGVCGGFQILGIEIRDPHGIESGGKTVAGLGLLPVVTTLAREKTLASVTARHVDSALPLKGYEIHHGHTEGDALRPAVVREDGEVIGIRSPDGLLWGTYLHGIFDADGFRRWFIDRLRTRRGLAPANRILAAYDLESAFESLAGIVRRSLRVEEIYRLMGLR